MSGLRFRPATSEERQLALLWSAATVSALALRPAWIAVAPHLRPCVFRKLTGIPCPTCGTTRTALALLELDPLAALFANPLAAVSGMAFVIGGLLALMWWLLNGPSPVLQHPWSRRWTMTILGIVAVNWIYLIVTH